MYTQSVMRMASDASSPASSPTWSPGAGTQPMWAPPTAGYGQFTVAPGMPPGYADETSAQMAQAYDTAVAASNAMLATEYEWLSRWYHDTVAVRMSAERAQEEARRQYEAYTQAYNAYLAKASSLGVVVVEPRARKKGCC
mmetsp:Transcript_128520/g.359677  ORF Transcript_128520/g.359677 Transcript_128520/m.359677 type:complete len:140 (-) Transcript_128520:138-557(-)